MNKFQKIKLFILNPHLIYKKIFIYERYKNKFKKDPYYLADIRGEEAHNFIYNMLNSKKDLFISRFGTTELDCLFCSTKLNKKVSKTYDFSLNIYNMGNGPGFFPVNKDMLYRYSNELLSIIGNIDILATISMKEIFFKKELKNVIKRIPLPDLEPFYVDDPWIKYIEGKKVLVIHPFKDTIEYQLKRKDLWLKNKKWLPDCDIKIIKAVQSLAGNNPEGFETWFDALDYMKKKIVEIGDFDIALIGCGAYGMFLGDYIKKLGKQAVIIGGALQLLFGIKGKRWEEMDFYREKVFNEHWIRPLDSDKMENFQKVEGGCYW